MQKFLSITLSKFRGSGSGCLSAGSPSQPWGPRRHLSTALRPGCALWCPVPASVLPWDSATAWLGHAFLDDPEVWPGTSAVPTPGWAGHPVRLEGTAPSYPTLESQPFFILGWKPELGGPLALTNIDKLLMHTVYNRSHRAMSPPLQYHTGDSLCLFNPHKSPMREVVLLYPGVR